ncbi:MAG TPA: hypothetical protein VHR66_16790 [Gemmataceae bacterium]|nr:hypothetical protein [Gemmataceae bacterium]
MDSSEPVPTDDWAPLEHLWEDIADAWFKAEGETSSFMFRIPAERFQSADADRTITVEDLLDAAAIPREEVQSWRLDDADVGETWTNSDVCHSLPPPPPGASHLTVYIEMKPPAAAADDESAPSDVTSTESDIPPDKWQALDAFWKTILGLEASIDALRLSMGSVASEMETAFRQGLAVEEKVNALQADVAIWNKGKSRIHYALPKLREFIHRATWATAAPERKQLEEIVKEYVEPRVSFKEIDEVRERLVHLQKDRQVLQAQGNSVNQECRGILAEVQRAHRTLQRNAADRVRKQKEARQTKGKYL